jgi:hypothetical protein
MACVLRSPFGRAIAVVVLFFPRGLLGLLQRASAA